MKKTNLKSLTRNELNEWIQSQGENNYRAAQLWSWLYQKNVIEFTRMTNVSRKFQSRLQQIAEIYTLEPIKSVRSERSGTEKFLWNLGNGNHIESVFIPEGNRRTLCISSQVGCAVGCRFCATATMGFVRNLEVHEIVEQVLAMERHVHMKPSNLVIMGMGEPMLNYENVIKALTILNHPDGAAIGHRKITISTSGIIPAIERYTREKQPFKLAISLNATTDETRSKIMPINKKYPLNQLMQAAKIYTQKIRKRITFEYVLLKGMNDSPEDAQRLLRMLHGIPCKVNLIAYNAVGSSFQSPDNARIEAFARMIRPLAAPVTLRLSKGNDINAACGQLVTSGRSAGCST